MPIAWMKGHRVQPSREPASPAPTTALNPSEWPIPTPPPMNGHGTDDSIELNTGTPVKHPTYGAGVVTRKFSVTDHEEELVVKFEAEGVEMLFPAGTRELEPRVEWAPLEHLCGAPPNLPESHAAWDNAAAALPSAWRAGTIRSLIEAIPLLAADEASLPAMYLPRAASLLAFFAHGFFHFSGASALPGDNVLSPWSVVSSRLGRRSNYLHVDDQIMANWQVCDEEMQGRLRLAAERAHERLDHAGSKGGSYSSARQPTVWEEAGWGPHDLLKIEMLTPFFGGRAGGVASEENFLMTITLMHIVSAPLVELTVRAQEAAMADDRLALLELISEITAVIEQTTEAFMQIHANEHAPTYVDPVQWSHTVAVFPLPIPPEPDSAAASGLMVPVFHLLDCFIGRVMYQSMFGSIGQRERHRSMPPNILNFLGAISRVSVRDYIQQAADPLLVSKWNVMVDSYCGERGFLGVHAFKAAGYLEAAVKVGRVSTIGTEEESAEIDDDWRHLQWHKPVDAMHKSRAEREPCRISTQGNAQPCFFSQLPLKARTNAVRCPFTGKPAPEGTNGSAVVACPFGGGAPLGSSAVAAHVVIDSSTSGLRFESGDIVNVAGSNSAEMVVATYSAMLTREHLASKSREALIEQMRGQLVVPTGAWRDYCAEVGIQLTRGSLLSVYDVLTYGRITALPASMVDTVIFHSPHIVTNGVTNGDADALPLWQIVRWTGLFGDAVWNLEDLFSFLYADHQLQLADSEWIFSSTGLCEIVPPLIPRSFSIASDPRAAPGELHLCIGRQQWTMRDETRSIKSKTLWGTLKSKSVLSKLRGLGSIVNLVANFLPSETVALFVKTYLMGVGGGGDGGGVALQPSAQSADRMDIDAATVIQRAMRRRNTANLSEQGGTSSPMGGASRSQFSWLDEIGKKVRKGVVTNALVDEGGASSAPETVRLRVQPSLRFHLPANPRTPLLLFAAGTGIAPFRAFLQGRLSRPGGGPITLYYGCKDASVAPFIDELEGLAAAHAETFSLRVCISRGEVRAGCESFEVAGRVDKAIAADAAMIWKVLRPPTDDDTAPVGSIYACGMSPFGETVEQGLLRIIEANVPTAAEAHSYLAQLCVGGRYALHMYGGKGSGGRSIQLSEVATKRGGPAGAGEAWWVYDGDVFDVGRYAALHPGGSIIVLDKAGRDTTSEFDATHWSNRAEYVAYMQVYRIGKLSLPVFTVDQPNGKEAAAWHVLVEALHFSTAVCNTFRTCRMTANVPDGWAKHKAAIQLHLQTIGHGGYIDRLLDSIDKVAHAFKSASSHHSLLSPASAITSRVARVRKIMAESRAAAKPTNGESALVNATTDEIALLSVRRMLLSDKISTDPTEATKRHKQVPPAVARLMSDLLEIEAKGLEAVQQLLVKVTATVEGQGCDAFHATKEGSGVIAQLLARAINALKSPLFQQTGMLFHYDGSFEDCDTCVPLVAGPKTMSWGHANVAYSAQ